jgi:hypothetical protein
MFTRTGHHHHVVERSTYDFAALKTALQAAAKADPVAMEAFAKANPQFLTAYNKFYVDAKKSDPNLVPEHKHHKSLLAKVEAAAEDVVEDIEEALANAPAAVKHFAQGLEHSIENALHHGEKQNHTGNAHQAVDDKKKNPVALLKEDHGLVAGVAERMKHLFS